MSSGTSLRNDIQGLRAVAVLGVIVYHFNRHWLPGGFTGVDIFFVISGYLITQIILRKKEDRTFSLSGFYRGRVQRIVPAYAVMLMVVAVAMSVFLIPKDFDTFDKSLRAALLFNSNGFFATQNDYFAPAAYELPLLHTWSLAVEMQFYLILPLLLLALPKRWLNPALLLLMVSLFLLAEYWLQQNQRQAVYFSLMARAPEFLIGSLAFVLCHDRRLSKRSSNIVASLGAVLVFSSFFLVAETHGFPGILALVPCLGVACLLVSPRSGLNRALSFPPLVWLGALSYSLYLWHWPVLAAIRYVTGAYALDGVSTFVFAVLTLGLSYLSYRCIEIPFRANASLKQVGVRMVGLVAIAMVSIVIAIQVNPRLVEPLSIELTRYAKGDEICHGKRVGDCIRGDKASDRTLLLLGDSHAAQLNYFADVVGNAIHAKIEVITSSSCVTIPGFDAERIIEGARQDCLDQIEQGVRDTPGADGIIIAGMWQYQAPSAKFMEQLDRFISQAAARNQEVMVLAQVPMLLSNPQRIHRANSMGFHASAAIGAEWIEANAKVEALVARHKNAFFLNLSNQDFFAQAPMQNNTLIYQDTHHLNEIGSARYGEIAVPFFKAFMDKISLSGKAAAGLTSAAHHP